MRRKWLMAILRRRNLPEAVTLTRFAMALCVFNFCFIALSFLVFDPRGNDLNMHKATIPHIAQELQPFKPVAYRGDN